MLAINTLIRKPEIDKEGERIIDLSHQTFSFKNDVNIKSTGLVTDELVMRPDLIAKIYYGNINKVDYILKFNGISNPFSLDAGTVLLIGDEQQLDSCFTGSVTPDEVKDVRENFFDPTKLSKKDVKRLEMLKNKTKEQGSTSSNLPPNMADVGSKEITIKDGVVIFGNDVTGIKDNCPTPISRAALKAKLIANNTFGTNK